MAATRVVFLGTGNAFNTDGRGSQAIWVEPEGEPPTLVDVGPTALASLERLKLSPGRLARVLFTHLHGDHIGGWPFLLLHWMFSSRREAPIQVVGPVGTERRLRELAALCYESIVDPEMLQFELEFRELPIEPARGLDCGPDLRFDVEPLEHHPTSLGYRLRLGEHTVGITGDTRWCPGLEELSRGCDLFIVECSSLEPTEYAHVSLKELREGVGRLQSRRVVLVHLTDEVARALEAEPIPHVTAAVDGMTVELPGALRG